MNPFWNGAALAHHPHRAERGSKKAWIQQDDQTVGITDDLLCVPEDRNTHRETRATLGDHDGVLAILGK